MKKFTMHDGAPHRLLNAHEMEQAADVISQAFIDDPLCSFMLPLKRTRLKTLKKFFRPMSEIAIKNNRLYGVGDPLLGVAFWKSPDQQGTSVNVRSLGSFLPLLFTYYPIGYFRARRILEKIDAMHDAYAQEPHFYLDNIGVLASARGQGISSKLIRPFLEQADEQRAIVYTDTVTRQNVSLYEHFGFECVEEAPIPGTGVTIWAMRRSVQK